MSSKDHEIDPQAANVPVATLFELRAENEQLKRERDMLVLDRDAFEKDVERLRAARDACEQQFQEKVARVNELDDENERLRAEVEQVELINFRRVEENTRLRKALTMIRNAVDITRDQVTEGWIIGVADDALKLG